MAGAYRMALARATVEVLDAEGNTVATHDRVTAAVRDGKATARINQQVVAELDGADVVATGRNRYTITGTDGTSWVVSKKCGCAGGR